MEELESTVKRSQMALAVIERAMNDATGWTIGAQGICIEAQVIVSEEGVTFWTVFPGEWEIGLGREPKPISYISVHRVSICHKGEVLWVAGVTPPETGAFEVEVTLLLSQTVAV